MSNQIKFTNRITSELRENGDYCPHCSETDLKAAVGAYVEHDSFGIVGANIVCQKCKEETDEVEGNEEVCCHDCHRMMPRKQTIEWKWYDFYAAQGDEPLIICDSCRGKEQHQTRVANDNASYKAEFGDGDDQDDDDDIHVGSAWADEDDDNDDD